MPHEISEKTDIIARLLLSTKGIASMRKLVHGLFTESEILEIAQRLEIVRLLKKRHTTTQSCSAVGSGSRYGDTRSTRNKTGKTVNHEP